MSLRARRKGWVLLLNGFHFPYSSTGSSAMLDGFEASGGVQGRNGGLGMGSGGSKNVIGAEEKYR